MNPIDLNYRFRSRGGLLSDTSYFYLIIFMTFVYVVGSISNIFALIVLSFITLSLICAVATTNQLVYTLFFFTPMYLYVVIGTFPIYNVIILLLVFKRLMDKNTKLNLLFSFLLISIITLEVIHLLVSNTSPSFNTIKLFLIIFIICQHLFETPGGYSNAVGIKYLLAGTFIYAAAFLWINQSIVVTDSFRLGGLGELDPNTYGLYNLLAISLLGQRLLVHKQRPIIYPISFVIIGVILMAGALTLSKTYFLTTIGMTMIFVIASMKNKFQFFTLTSVLLSLGFILSRLPYFISTIDKILGRFEMGRRAGDITTGRTFIYHDYLNYLQEHVRTVVVGEGMYSYMNNFEIRPHNTFIELVMSWGILGGTIFISLFVVGAFKYRQNMKKQEKINLLNFIPIILLLIYSQSLTLLYQEATYVYIIISIMVILGNEKVTYSPYRQLSLKDIG